jgi:hypothetical protein
VYKFFFSNSSALFSDMNPIIALKDGRLLCRVCNTMFKCLANAKGHLRAVHGSGSVRCSLCNRISKNAKAFGMHLRTMHDIKGVANATGNYGKVITYDSVMLASPSSPSSPAPPPPPPEPTVTKPVAKPVSQKKKRRATDGLTKEKQKV